LKETRYFAIFKYLTFKYISVIYRNICSVIFRKLFPTIGLQNYTKKADGDIEAKLVSLCCCEPPEGFAKWSLKLLADKMVELSYIDYISHATVGEILKKTNLSLGR
jgi:hypothetical protein